DLLGWDAVDQLDGAEQDAARQVGVMAGAGLLGEGGVRVVPGGVGGRLGEGPGGGGGGRAPGIGAPGRRLVPVAAADDQGGKGLQETETFHGLPPKMRKKGTGTVSAGH